MSWLDLTNDTVAEDSSAVPAGKYNVNVERAEVKDSKSGGQYISVMYRILSGPQENRVIFNMFNIKNANEKAVEIGRQQLKQLMIASGKSDFSLGRVTDLEGLKCSVTTKVVTDDYGEKAVVKGHYEPFEEVSTKPLKEAFNSDDIPF